MQAKRVFMLLNDDPQISTAARERIDLALTLAASDWPLTVAFVGAGVQQLRRPHADAPLRDFAAALGSLELFGAETVLVDGASLQQYAIDGGALRIPAQIVDLTEIARHARLAEQIL